MLAAPVASKGLLFSSFLYRADLHEENELISFWEGHYGPSFSLIPKSNPLSDYYSHEMGKNLSRLFLVTHQKFPREYLLTSKLLALKWEDSWQVNNARMVNIDTGFLSLENFLLATTKNYSHRIYLGQNIFADLTFYFNQGEFTPLPWTYPDYLDDEKLEFLTWARTYLLQTRNS